MRIDEVGEATLVVGAGDTAKALSLSAGDDFPEVLATTRMIVLMELAAARAMRDEVGEGEMSVGVGVDVRHLAATPVGVEVKAVATFLGREGKLYRFRVQAVDPGGVIGEGHHTRAVVRTERLLAGARARIAKT